MADPIPRLLRLSKSAATPITVWFQGRDAQPADLTGATAAKFVMVDAVAATPVYSKTGTLTTASSKAVFSPTSGEATAWPVGRYTARVWVKFSAYSQPTEEFAVVVDEALGTPPT